MARGEQVIRLRLTAGQPDAAAFGPEFDALFEARIGDADELYASVTPPSLDEDQARVLRQALAGMLWRKQYSHFDADKWLDEHGADPFRPGSRHVRNKEWFHRVNDHVISMPDKWEYPWYAAWDLAFHTIPLSMLGLAPHGFRGAGRSGACPESGRVSTTGRLRCHGDHQAHG
jgi:hypothetical protein